MNLSELNPSAMGARLIAIIVAGILAVLVVWAAFHFWEKSRSQAAQSRVTNGQSGAFTNSSADAINVVAASGNNAAASEALTRTNSEEIHNAPGADQKVDAGVDVAGRRSLCRRAAYRDDPKCRVFEPTSK